MKRISTVIWLVLSLGWMKSVYAEPVELQVPGPEDTCPVCGMFVAKYPEWIATVRYKDGHAHHFDGAKDLFKYLLDLPKWAPNHQAGEIEVIGVTEYYGLTRIDARKAFYVIGSDVLGPMGHELIPLETKEDAEEYLRDHKGLSIVLFNDITLEQLQGLDAGVFE
ncbi:MAG: nitrous oxide reductase accessory protein NosL [Candidatus Thiodiazotropha sp. (ex Monitilora ramsayi)]|nr:nitrous oxide reductase accessory protein NosL [Candidatus Thiodiazotropha sp. (ex Monitilora ramsayi)]